MRLTGCSEGDLVRCDVKGTRFFAAVVCPPTNGSVEIEPISRGCSYRRVRARDVIGLYRKAKGSK